MFKLSKTNKEQGFSLVELVIVVVIIGILAAIAIPIYSNQVREAEIATLKSDVQATGSAFKNWERSQGYQAVPDNTTFDSQLVVKSDPANNITHIIYDPNDPENFEVCILGTRDFGSGDIVKWNYNFQTSRLTEGDCVNTPNLNAEIPN